jgi:hypothetical protein
MAYFSNGSAGEVFVEQCSTCRYGTKPCPIAMVQSVYNYDACINETASKILNDLVKNDGTCEMKKEFIDDFRIIKDINQTIMDL